MSQEKVVGMVLAFRGCAGYPSMMNADYPRWAACAARRFTDVTGHECRLVGEDEVGYRPRDFLEMLLVRMLWPRLLPDAGVVVSIDADCCWMRPWDPRPLCADGRSLATSRMPVWAHPGTTAWYREKGLDPDRLVSGFWAAPRGAAPLFEEVVDRWAEVSRVAMHDVGALSRVVQDRGWPVAYQSLRLQWWGWGGLGPRVGVTSVHNGMGVYDWWDAGGPPATPAPDLEWDEDAMRVRAGVGGRRADGSSEDGLGWFVSGGREYRFDAMRNELCQ